MCQQCFSILNTFNEFKINSIESQNNFEQLLIRQHEQQQQYDDEEYQIEALENDDDDDGLIEYSNDYSQAVEDTEAETEPESILHQETCEEEILESNDFTQIEINTRKASRRCKSEKPNGREIYQRLLQPCAQCGKIIEKNRMEGHVNKCHIKIRPFKCEVCNKTFYCKLLLRLHKTSIHTGLEVECQICYKKFPSARSLYTHSKSLL
jgi:hypothetical protein